MENKLNIKIGDKINYTTPALPLVSPAGNNKGIIVRFGKRSIWVKDLNSEQKYCIDGSQVISIIN